MCVWGDRGGEGEIVPSQTSEAKTFLFNIHREASEYRWCKQNNVYEMKERKRKENCGGGGKTQAVEKGEFSSPFWRDVSEAKGRVIQFAKRGCSFLVMLCKCALQKRSFRAWKPASKWLMVDNCTKTMCVLKRRHILMSNWVCWLEAVHW